jgi:hypothetical protein
MASDGWLERNAQRRNARGEKLGSDAGSWKRGCQTGEHSIAHGLMSRRGVPRGSGSCSGLLVSILFDDCHVRARPHAYDCGSRFLRGCRLRAAASLSSGLCTESAPTVAHCGHSKNVMRSRRAVTLTSAPQCGHVRLDFSDIVIQGAQAGGAVIRTANLVTTFLRRPDQLESVTPRLLEKSAANEPPRAFS